MRATSAPPIEHDLESLCGAFLQTEVRNGFFALDLQGSRFWDYIRFFVFHDIATSLGVEQPYEYTKASRWKRVSGAFREVASWPQARHVRFLPGRVPPADLVFFDAQHRKADGRYRGNTRGLPFILAAAEVCSTLVVDPSPFDGAAADYPGPVLTSRPWRFVRRAAVRRFALDGAARRTVSHVADVLASVFGVRPNVEHLLCNVFAPQQALKGVTVALLRRTRAKAVGFLNDSHRKFVAEAGHEVGIPVFDLQHGATSRVDLNYLYPAGISARTVPTLPDILLTYGDYWNDRFGLQAERRVVGFRNLDEVRAESGGGAPQRRGVVCVSVWNRSLADLLAAAARRLPDTPFVYKLRPEEYDSWRERSAPLIGLPNVTVVADDAVSLYDHFLQASYVLTVDSTALFEGMAFGLTPLIYRGPNSEHYWYLVDRGEAIGVDDADDLVRVVGEEPRTQRIESTRLFAADSAQRIREAVTGLLAAA